MKKYLALLFVLLLPHLAVASSSSAINPANTGNIGGYQGTSTTRDSGMAFTIDNIGTYTNFHYEWRREGDRLKATISAKSGTLVGSPLAVVLPSGYQIDLAKVTANQTRLGRVTGLYSATIFYTSGGWVMEGFSDGSDASRIFFGYKGNGTDAYAKGNGNDLMSNSGSATFEIDVPILGWSAGGSGSSGSVSQLIKTGGNAGLGSTNTSVMKWGSTVSTLGSNVSYVETAANGGYWLIGASGDVEIDFDYGDSAATTTIGIAIDSTGSALSNGGTTLAGNPRLLAPSDGVYGKTKSTDSSSYVHTHFSMYLSAGAKIYALQNSGAAANANCIFSVKLRTY